MHDTTAVVDPRPGRAPAGHRLGTAPLSPRAAGALLLVLLASGALAVVALWWRDTVPGTLRTPGGLMTAAGRIVGLLAGYLLVVQVALMARVPWLERVVGTHQMARIHRAFGEYLVCMLSAHAALIVVGYAQADRLALPREAAVVVFDYPNVLLATVALALLVAIGATSARALRRQTSYEVWHGVHLLAYPAVALGFLHQFSNGADFTDNRPVRLLWSAMHVAVAFLLVQFRVVGPVLFALRHRLRVAAVVPEAPDVVSIYVTGRRLRELRVLPGQFFRWRFFTRGLWWQARPFSLSAAPDGVGLRITVKALGDHTDALQRLRPGVRVSAEGPYGAFTASLRTARGVLLVAGGVGVTPLRAMLDVLSNRPGRGGEVTLVYRASRPVDLVFSRELDWLARQGRVVVHYLVGPRAVVPALLGPDRLRALVPDVADRDVFVCGPPGMVEAACRAVRALGVPRRRLHVERFEI